MVFPYARSPYLSSVLYTPKFSRALTAAKGVHGMIDLTVPGGALLGWESDVAGGNSDPLDIKESGFMKRILSVVIKSFAQYTKKKNHTCGTD